MSYYYNHREERIEYAKQYAIEHYDLIREKRQIYYDCECGRTVKELDKTTHFKSQFHQQYLIDGNVKPIKPIKSKKIKRIPRSTILCSCGIYFLSTLKNKHFKSWDHRHHHSNMPNDDADDECEPIIKTIKTPKKRIKRDNPLILCDCGVNYYKNDKSRHIQTKCHIMHHHVPTIGNKMVENKCDNIILRFD